MHFVGDGVGFLRRVLVIVFVIAFLITLVIVFLISVQRFLQLFEFGGLYKRFGHGFDGLGALFGIGLRFFVLGFGKLFGERGDIFLGEVRAIRSVRVRRSPPDRASGSSLSRSSAISVSAAGEAAAYSGALADDSALKSAAGVSCSSGIAAGGVANSASRQSRGQFFVRESPWRRQRGGSSGAERRMFGRRRRGSGRNAILEF